MLSIILAVFLLGSLSAHLYMNRVLQRALSENKTLQSHYDKTIKELRLMETELVNIQSKFNDILMFYAQATSPQKRGDPYLDRN